MISNHDRSGWFGASDTATIMGNYNTATFKKWWLEKMGIRQSTFTNKAMKAGTHYEHNKRQADYNSRIALEGKS